jgi:hypothetical protein
MADGEDQFAETEGIGGVNIARQIPFMASGGVSLESVHPASGDCRHRLSE